MPSLDKRSKKKQRVDDSSGDDEPGTQGARNDALLAKVDPEYLNKPIDIKQGEAKTRALVASLGTVKKKLGESIKTLIDIAGEMAETLSEEHRDEDYHEDAKLAALKNDKIMSQLDRDFRAALDREAELEIRMTTASDLRMRIAQGHQMTNVHRWYEDKAKDKLEEYTSKTPRQRYENNVLFERYRTLVWESYTDGRGVPNIKKFLPREEGDDESDDEDFEFGAQTHNFQCPITLSTLEDPYSSSLCPHSFSGDAIKELIKSSGGRSPCPVSGCDKSLTLGTVHADEGLRRRVAAHVRRVKEGRAPGATQGRTFEQMDLDSEDEDEDDDGEEAHRVKKEMIKAARA
ncbi:NSE2 family E3 SUMO-protein ligase [Rhodotorula paludigena]|uniref:NSE2 family E3 SUMO-protein ligase n=1 Tax=Rhodotorula paludigena TaxID=86838 RepID=UPI003174F606